MEIIEYDLKYLDDVRALLTELEEYIVSIDIDKLDVVHKDYYEKMALVDLEKINKSNGKCFLALEKDKVVGLVMGCIPLYDEFDYLDYKCPRRGVVNELVVTEKARRSCVGLKLLKAMENYFINNGCEYVIVDVFAYNDKAINFYNKCGYHTRMYTNIKKLGR